LYPKFDDLGQKFDRWQPIARISEKWLGNHYDYPAVS
jgi:hypothetical protein